MLRNNRGRHIMKKFLMEHKIACSIILCILCVLVVSSLFVAVNFPNSQIAENCFSIAFDKWSMNVVNKIIIETPKQKIMIHDNALVDRIVKETMVAECGGVNAMYGEYRLLLYSDEDLVRTVQLSSTDKQYAIVYAADSKHWVFGYDNGTVILSDELILQIEQFCVKNNDVWGWNEHGG